MRKLLAILSVLCLYLPLTPLAMTQQVMPVMGTTWKGTASSVTFAYIRGSLQANSGSGTSCVVAVSGGAPALGTLVEYSLAIVYTGTAPTSFSVHDGTPNTYTATTSTPLSGTLGSTKVIIGKWYYVAGASTNNTVTGSWTNNAASSACWIDNYSITGGTYSFDKDVAGSATTCSGTTANTPSINPTNAGSLTVVVGIDTDNSFTAPVASGTLGVWTGTQGGPEVNYTGGNTEYKLATTGSTAAQFTCGGSGDHYISLAAAYK